MDKGTIARKEHVIGKSNELILSHIARGNIFGTFMVEAHNANNGNVWVSAVVTVRSHNDGNPGTDASNGQKDQRATILDGQAVGPVQDDPGVPLTLARVHFIGDSRIQVVLTGTRTDEYYSVSVVFLGSEFL